MPEPGGMNQAACRECKVGQDSVNGSAQCTICAEHYYRPHASSPVDDCISCSTIRGVGCPTNATIETLIVDRGRWRLSTLTSRTYRCAWHDNQTACDGGGGSLCAPGHEGPLCQVCIFARHHFRNALCQECPEPGIGVAMLLAAFSIIMLFYGALQALHEQRSRKYDRVAVPLRRLVHRMRSFSRSIGLVAKLKLALTLCDTHPLEFEIGCMTT